MQTRKYDEFGAVFLEPGGTPLKARLILFAATMFLLSAPASAQQGVVDLSSAAPTRVEHRDDGLIIMNYDLPESSRNPRAKSVFTYIVFTSPEPPGLNPIVTLNIAPPEFIPHYYTLAVVNFGNRTATGNVTLKLTGPVRWTRRFRNLTVPAFGYAVYGFQAPPLNRIGNYLLKGSFTGAGAMKSRFCAGCLS